MARVKGDSMSGAALVGSNLVVVQNNCPTRVDNIVVAFIDGQVTVKYRRLQPAGCFFVQAANPDFADIFPMASWKSLMWWSASAAPTAGKSCTAANSPKLPRPSSRPPKLENTFSSLAT